MELLDFFPVQRNVQALAFLLFGDAQSNGHVDYLQKDEADDKAINHRGSDPPQLRDDGAVAPLISLLAKTPGQQRADDAADAVHAEGVQRIVITERTFFSEVAAKKQPTPATRPMITAGVGPTKPEAGVIATRPATAPDAMPSTLGLPLANPFGEHPRQRRSCRSDLRSRHGHAGAAIGGDGGTGVEAEPAHPQQRGADQVRSGYAAASLPCRTRRACRAPGSSPDRRYRR
jgi:hypothetical protein